MIPLWMIAAGAFALFSASKKSGKKTEKQRRAIARQTMQNHIDFGRSPDSAARAGEVTYRELGGEHPPFIGRLHAAAVQVVSGLSSGEAQQHHREDQDAIAQAMRASVRDGLSRDVENNGLSMADAAAKARRTYRQLGGTDLEFYRELDHLSGKGK